MIASTTVCIRVSRRIGAASNDTCAGSRGRCSRSGARRTINASTGRWFRERVRPTQRAIDGDQSGLRLGAAERALVLPLEQRTLGVEYLKEVGASLHEPQSRQLRGARTGRRRFLQVPEPLARLAVRHERRLELLARLGERELVTCAGLRLVR